MNIFIAGDVVGGPGRLAFAAVTGRLKQAGQVDFVIANGENAAGGRGITQPLAEALFAAGADVVTLGDHAWDQKELAKTIDREPRLVRPANFAPGCPGRGWSTFETPCGKITVLSLQGRTFMPPTDCPFRAADAILQRGAELGKVIIVDMHAEATSEKIAMGRYLDGRVSAVVGTHTHVQTADEAILPKGTAYLTDLGMTGPKDSVLGRDVAAVLKKFLTGMPQQFDIATGDVRCEGLLVTVDEQSGRATKVKRIQEKLDAGK
ncbi:MAG: TIGR00282 family metallophosphoesterase [Kiritimatiellaeota bacterium]|nr:TIGR00282 family metallophosphoesterase [Kiritimatiellota bacterium]